MDRVEDSFPPDVGHPTGVWAAVLTIQGFIERLARLFRLTEQDLIDAGVVFRQTRD